MKCATQTRFTTRIVREMWQVTVRAEPPLPRKYAAAVVEDGQSKLDGLRAKAGFGDARADGVANR